MLPRRFTIRDLFIVIASIPLLIIGLIIQNYYKDSTYLKEAYRKEDRVEILFYLKTERYQKVIEKAGFTIPPRQKLRVDNTLEIIEVGKEIPIKISKVDRYSDKFDILFTRFLDGKKIDVVYSLNSKLELTSRGDYTYWNEKTKRTEEVAISTEEESRLLRIIQAELLDFFDKTKKTLYGWGKID
ncbi:MAG: hypothetical protein Q4A90_01840 [Streptococcus sp.]|nr:hypothetical protein [Streptococcus sp.]